MHYFKLSAFNNIFTFPKCKIELHQNAITIPCWRPTSGHTWLCFMCVPCQSGTSNVLINGPGVQESAHCVSLPHFVIHWCHKRPQDTKWWSYKRIYTFALKWSVEHFSGWSDVRVSFPALGEEDSRVYFGRLVRGGTMTTGVVCNGFITGVWPFMSRITLIESRIHLLILAVAQHSAWPCPQTQWPMLSNDL